MTLRAYLLRSFVRVLAYVIGYVIAGALVLGIALAACSGIVPGHREAPAYVAPAAPSGDVWGLPITEPTEDRRPTPAPSRRPVVLPSGPPAGLDIEDLCAELEAPGDVPECADLGYE